MSKQIHKSLKEYLSKIKGPTKQIHFQLPSCKHRRTPPLGGKEKDDDAVALAEIDKFLFENFRSLYQKEYEEEISKKNETKTASHALESPRLDTPPPEYLCRSERFFISTGSSGSHIFDKASSSSTSASNGSSPAPEELPKAIAADDSSAPEDFIALLTYSPSPYEDFRRSMQEMVEARMEHNGKVDWKFLEELLFCYIDLNNKKSYRFILRAFVDLIVVLRENSVRAPASRQMWNGGYWRMHLK